MISRWEVVNFEFAVELDVDVLLAVGCLAYLLESLLDDGVCPLDEELLWRVVVVLGDIRFFGFFLLLFFFFSFFLLVFVHFVIIILIQLYNHLMKFSSMTVFSEPSFIL